jgi:hypothetical protein
MKLSTFHKRRGDEVHFVHGCGENAASQDDSANAHEGWDRIYITTLFTFNWDKTIRTIKFYREIAGNRGQVFVGGIMASLMPKETREETGIDPVVGVLHSPRQIGLESTTNIDLLPPDYDLLDRRRYALNETYYAYTTRGCTNRCGWCGVSVIEPEFVPYIDVKETLKHLRKTYGDKPKLKLMDNNVLASNELERIVDDLVSLGYGRGCFTETRVPKARVIDFNQGLDATFITEEKIRLLARLNLEPMRIAFDRLQEREEYLRAIELAKDHGIRAFSNYMLYGFNDTPRDLYERLKVNTELNARWRAGGVPTAKVYSYPMRYAPINSKTTALASDQESGVRVADKRKTNSAGELEWNRRFMRNVEVMKGAAFGAISSTPDLATRTIGGSYDEFTANLYMPEDMLRNRNKYERRVYKREPSRKPGTGDIEAFRSFILQLVKARDCRFLKFLEVVSRNRRAAIREYMHECKDEEIMKWLDFYLK